MFNIVKGHINELLKKQQDLYEQRIKICNECPLKTKTSLGVICDNKKCIENDSIYNNKNNLQMLYVDAVAGWRQS